MMKGEGGRGYWRRTQSEDPSSDVTMREVDEKCGPVLLVRS